MGFLDLSELHHTKKLWGITVYEIAGNGCLNGLGTNNDNGKSLINEIARKKDGSHMKDVDGEYIVSYIEPKDDRPFSGTLIITPNANGSYKFQWKQLKDCQDLKREKIGFEGVGLKTGMNQITAFYWQTQE